MARGPSVPPGPGGAAPRADPARPAPPQRGAAAGPARASAGAGAAARRTLVISLRRVRLVLGPLGWSG